MITFIIGILRFTEYFFKLLMARIYGNMDAK
ncbi:hypothetical protein QFZ73_004659 [Peribacillus sp. V2I11]|nr:hypothetical protein [Peribacillus sp. V2I11]